MVSSLIVVMFAWVAVADEPPQERFAIERDAEAIETRIIIESRNGRVAWADIAKALSRYRGFDDAGLARLNSRKSFSLDNKSTRWQLLAYNTLLAPHVRLEIDRPEDEDPRLVMIVDREAVQRTRRAVKELIRETSMDELLENPFTAPARRDYGLALPRDWQQTTPTRIVVSLHGINSTAARMRPLVEAFRDAGHASGVFEYPNDQSIDSSAELLSAHLKVLKRQAPDRPVTLVAHSMGGLVARAVIEDPELDPGNVDQLLMLATPNQGSFLAHNYLAGDVWERLADGTDESLRTFMVRSLEDGLSEAARDLRPNSPFLLTLNRRSRNANVHYTLVMGTRGPLSEEQLQKLRDRIERIQEKKDWLRFLGGRVQMQLAELDEVLRDKGDGAVAVRRAELQGVDDVIHLPVDHFQLLDPPDNETLQRLHRELLQRVPAD